MGEDAAVAVQTGWLIFFFFGLQVACRDYPHARHLCAKYPFSSTPHERHCDQVKNQRKITSSVYVKIQNYCNSLFNYYCLLCLVCYSILSSSHSFVFYDMQCHCYVCDSLAPCPNWGSGKLSSDHCHANDTTEVWKLQRKNFKLGLSSPLPASTNYGTAVHVVYPQRNLRRENIHLPSNSMRRYQGSRSKVTHTCFSLNSISQNQSSWLTIMSTLFPL